MESHSLIKISRKKVISNALKILSEIKFDRQKEWEREVSKEESRKIFFFFKRTREQAEEYLKRDGGFEGDEYTGSTHQKIFKWTCENQFKACEDLINVYSKSNEEFVYLTIEDAKNIGL